MRCVVRKWSGIALVLGLAATFITGPDAWKWQWWVFLPTLVYVTATPGGWLAVLFGSLIGR